MDQKKNKLKEIYPEIYPTTLEDTQSSAQEQTRPFLELPKLTYPAKSWRWSDDSDCYLHFLGALRISDAYCLGNRIIYATFGRDSYGVFWNGTERSIGNPIESNTMTFDYDFRGALEWLQEAEYKEYGSKLWSI